MAKTGGGNEQLHPLTASSQQVWDAYNVIMSGAVKITTREERSAAIDIPMLIPGGGGLQYDQPIGPRKPDMSFPQEQLVKKFKHAPDFGVNGGSNAPNLVNFQLAIQQHIANPATRIISGTFRGQPVTHYLNKTTGINVMKDASGNFLSGFKLNSAQLKNVAERGSL